MGFIKDIRTLNKMGNDIQRNSDVGGRMAHAQASLAQTNKQLAAMAARSNSTASLTGTPTTASVVGARDSGQYFNMQPLIAIDLLVQLPGGFPTPVTIHEVVAPLHLVRLTPGSALAVKVGATPHDVVIDWQRWGS